MHRIPFRDVEEARENAKLLHRALAFYEIRFPEAQQDIGLQRTQELMAGSFRCVGWKDLVRRVELQGAVSYPDDEPERSSLHAELTQQLQARIGDHVPLDTLRAAISSAAVGCSAGRRGEARRFFCHCPAKTVSQWGRLMEVEAAYSYHTRYNQGKSAYDLRMQEYSRQVAVAKILGTPLPRKPQRPKSAGN